MKEMPISALLVSLGVLAVLVFVTLPPDGLGGGVLPSRRPHARLALRTAYLDHPLGSARQISLLGDLDGSLTLIFDPNQCTLDAYGNPEECTRRLPRRTPVTLRHVPTATREHIRMDALGDYELYDVVGETEVSLRLALPSSAGGSGRLLQLDPAGKVLRVVTLEAMP